MAARPVRRMVTLGISGRGGASGHCGLEHRVGLPGRAVRGRRLRAHLMQGVGERPGVQRERELVGPLRGRPGPSSNRTWTNTTWPRVAVARPVTSMVPFTTAPRGREQLHRDHRRRRRDGLDAHADDVGGVVAMPVVDEERHDVLASGQRGVHDRARPDGARGVGGPLVREGLVLRVRRAGAVEGDGRALLERVPIAGRGDDRRGGWSWGGRRGA